MAGKYAGRIAADAEEGRMSERHEAAQAQRDVETDGREAEDRHAGRKRDVERLTELHGDERHGQQQQGQNQIDCRFA